MEIPNYDVEGNENNYFLILFDLFHSNEEMKKKNAMQIAMKIALKEETFHFMKKFKNLVDK